MRRQGGKHPCSRLLSPFLSPPWRGAAQRWGGFLCTGDTPAGTHPGPAGHPSREGMIAYSPPWRERGNVSSSIYAVEKHVPSLCRVAAGWVPPSPRARNSPRPPYQVRGRLYGLALFSPSSYILGARPAWPPSLCGLEARTPRGEACTPAGLELILAGLPCSCAKPR